MMVTTKPGSPGRARSNRRAIAQGRPDCFRFTCMLMCALFFVHQMHMRPRVQRAPGLPCALFVGGRERNGKPRTKPCRENDDSHPVVPAYAGTHTPCALNRAMKLL